MTDALDKVHLLETAEAMYIPMRSLFDSADSEGAIPLSITQSWSRKAKGKFRAPDINDYGCLNFLPHSRLTLAIVQTGDNEFEFRCNGEVKDFGTDDEWHSKKKFSFNKEQAEVFLKTLRLVQMVLFAFKNRQDTVGREAENCLVPNSLIVCMTALDNAIQGNLGEYPADVIEEIKKCFNDLETLYRNRINEFIAHVNDIAGQKKETFLEIPLSGKESIDFSVNYISWSSGRISNIKSYFLRAPDTEVDNYIQDSLREALREIFAFPISTEDGSDDFELNSYSYPLPRLELSKNIDSPYDGVLSSCVTMESSGRLPSEVISRINVIKKLCKEDLTLKQMLNIETSPKLLKDEIQQIMINNNMKDVIYNTLLSELPGILGDQADPDNESINIKTLQDTSDLRGTLNFAGNRIVQFDREIESFLTAQDMRSDYNDQKLKLESLRELLKNARESSTPKLVEDGLEELKTALDLFEEGLENVSERSVNQNNSILWVGLGQGGSQILRECLLYCMDNVNDARSASLLSALGLKPKDLINLLKERNSVDSTTKKKAEDDLKRICNNKLQVLAVNIGSDIDKLILPSQPGYFLWGDKTDSDMVDVIHNTTNTLRLDPKMDGAGGSTGLGRAYGFARSTQLNKIINQVGRKNDSRSPSHVIITHSYAGGSGSGMTLPILQEIRRAFDPDTIIWVMSVGEGDTEDRDQAVFNTPFIISDVLQAHYDGIHSPADPVSPGQWKSFNGSLSRGYKDMLKNSKDLVELISGKEIAEENILNELENALKLDSFYHDRKQSLENLASILENCKEFKSEPPTVDTQSDFFDLLEIIPDDLNETKLFNKWCETFEAEGSRPALDFWMAWVESVSDPLGGFVTGENNTIKNTVESQSEDERRKDFTPALSPKDLDLVFKKLQKENDTLTLGTTVADNKPEGEPENASKVMSEGLAPLYNLLREKWSDVPTEGKKKFLEEVKSIIKSYKSSLKSYNQIRRELTRQIRALTGSSNDERVKNIIISNAHLERGVAGSGIPVDENSYTVFNSVIFDFILNIIGSQIPAESTYLTTAAEQFDEQDLVQHTKSPLVVGLFDHRDSLSLSETSLSERNPNEAMGKIFIRLFQNIELWNGKDNPLYCMNSLGGTIYLQNSLFGAKTNSMLQNNPYDTTEQTEEPEDLKELVREFEERWDSDDDLLETTKVDRDSLEEQYGCSSLHFGNLLRWISAIDIDTLSRILSSSFRERSESQSTRAAEIKRIEDKLESWKTFCPESPTYDNSLSRSDYELDSFSESSGHINHEVLHSYLPKLGIWNDNILRSVPPAYLNTYLPPLMLEEQLKTEEDEERKYLNALQKKSIWEYDNTLLDLGKMGKVKARLDKINIALDKIELQVMSIKKKTSTGGIENFPLLRLHPRLQRYLSALRSLPFKSDDYYLPARSTASLLPRYLMADSPTQGVGSYSTPTFQKAGVVMNWYRYLGLLPDENRFEWPALLRMVLLCDVTYDTLKLRLGPLSKIMSVNLDDFKDEITSILDIEYETSGLEIHSLPEKIWDQMTVLQKRMIATIPLANKLLANLPVTWRDGKIAIESWMEILNKVELIGKDNEEAAEITYQDSNAVEEILMQFQIALFKASVADSEDEIDETPLPVHHVRRLIYDVTSYLKEALLQAMYQSSNSKSERVHYEMTGFSDIIAGKPGGLLCLIHDKGTKMNKGFVQKTIRGNVHHSLGYLNTNKEFSTASRFGPNSTSTLVMMKAPINEAARQFSLAMGRLSGSSRDEYINKTKLHPYVFLYNLLWLPTNINRWIPADNEDYIRRFQIPLNVIEGHYSDPTKTIASIQSVIKEQAFKTGGVSLPEVDIRDFQGTQKDSNYRNIVNLIGIMALRHQHVCPPEDIPEVNLWADILSPDEFKILKNRHLREGAALTLNCLNPSAADDNEAEDNDDDDDIDWGDDDDDDDDEDIETLYDRGKAWFRAYKKWLDYSLVNSE
jgi:hypothetical protein